MGTDTATLETIRKTMKERGVKLICSTIHLQVCASTSSRFCSPRAGRSYARGRR